MELSEKILVLMSDRNETVGSDKLAVEFEEDHQKVVGAIKSLESLGEVIKTETETIKEWHLTNEGKDVVKRGSHEAVVYSAVPQNGNGISRQDLMTKVGAEIGKIGFSKALQQEWIVIDKNDNGFVKRKVDNITDVVQKDLSSLSQAAAHHSVPEKSLAEYKKRKLVEEKTVKRYIIHCPSQLSEKH